MDMLTNARTVIQGITTTYSLLGIHKSQTSLLSLDMFLFILFQYFDNTSCLELSF